MTDILFAQTRYHYMQYDDFWRIVSLSGFSIVYLDEVDWGKNQTVIFTPKNGELNLPPDKRAHVTWWNLERSKATDPVVDMSNPTVPPGVDEVWASDRAMAQATGARYVFLGGVLNFADIDVNHRDEFQIVTLMYWSHRRQQIQHDLFSRFSVADRAGSCWGDARHYALNHSQLMVSAHQDDYPWSEPIKWAVAAMYGLPLLSETCADPGYYERSQHYVSCALKDIPAAAEWVLDNEVLRRTLAANAWRLVSKERTFRSQVLEAVGQAVRV